MRRILVSACLMGEPVRYNGGAKRLDHPALARWRDEGRLVPFCPECAAGLPVPRAPAELEPHADAAAVLGGDGRVRDTAGRDVSHAFREGAERALLLAQASGCGFALLTDRSPSCGSRVIHSGRFDGNLRAGEGLTAHLLRRHGIAVFAEAEIDALADAVARYV